MGSRMSPKDDALYQAVGEVMHYIWDPIGVAGVPQARDEYYSYVPQVFGLLIKDVNRRSNPESHPVMAPGHRTVVIL
jgi:hypothetical protein